MARQPRIEFPGAVYHVISRGIERRDLFRDDDDRRRYLTLLEKAVDRFGLRLFAYCLMSNHVHLALEVGREPLSRIMRAVNTAYAGYFNVRHRRSGYLFQGRYKAFLVDADDYLLSLVRYVHNNPVEARIVERPDQYRWSSHASYLGQAPRWLAVDEVLSRFGRDRSKARQGFRAFFSKEEEAPYENARTWAQSVVGDEGFAETTLGKRTEVPLTIRSMAVDRLIDFVASREGLSAVAIRGQGRTAELARARSICGALASSVGVSVAAVARSLNRTQSAIWRQAQALEKSLHSNTRLAKTVESYRRGAIELAHNA